MIVSIISFVDKAKSSERKKKGKRLFQFCFVVQVSEKKKYRRSSEREQWEDKEGERKKCILSARER